MLKPAPWVIAGRYEMGEVVGRGGYGMVRRAFDRKTGQTVAVKVLSAEAGKDPHLVERMLREQQAMVAMAGTCAVSAIDLCRLASGAPCLVMEWLEGQDLERQMSAWEAEGLRPSLDRVLEILRPLTDTLARAHEIGIVHRDIKPANIFLTAGEGGDNGAVRLLDFGLARMRSAAPLTAIGMVMGSPSYIPPETWSGNSGLIDHRADLYSLAVIVFRALSGRLPFETPSLLDKLKLVTSAERPSVRAFCPDLPLSVDDWMRRALAIDPDLRFQSARAFYESLASALNGSAPPIADEEVSGVRTLVKDALPLPLEKRNALSVAWQRATSLLRRFTGQKSSDPTATPAPPEVSSGTSVEPSAAHEQAARGSDRPSVVWLDDSDVEELPAESVKLIEPGLSTTPAKPPRTGRSPSTKSTPKAKRRAKAKTKPKAKPASRTRAKSRKAPKAKASAARPGIRKAGQPPAASPGTQRTKKPSGKSARAAAKKR